MTGLSLTLPETRVSFCSRRSKALRALLLAVLLLSLALLAALPEARKGGLALCNRLFDASEAVNSYVYQRFPTAPGQSIGLAAALLWIAGIAWALLLVACSSRSLCLLTAGILALGQSYLGLALPGWLNILLFGGLGLLCMPRLTIRQAGAYLALLMLAAGVLGLVWPQVDTPTENASEWVRDHISATAQALVGISEEAPRDTIPETRRANPRSMESGDQPGVAERRFRLVTLEEQQISRPEWLRLLRIILLLLLAVAVVILPFLPFVWMNRRRAVTLSRRAGFEAEDRSQAFRAIFHHVNRYLEAAGLTGGNALYRNWGITLKDSLPEDYVQQYQDCCTLFEQAVYSDTALTEAQWQQGKDLLEETERLLYDGASKRQRFRLRYVECLHE